jgi:alkanesulfonate monooxygenase SsuD/methylene tetrahydromethanopterin reductase-like flavin-dependent oxidoreductase (luciferase family)
MPDRVGPLGFRIAATSGDGLDWPTLAATWERAAASGAFDAGWMSDHLTDAARERGGTGFEAFATLGALATRVPGHWVGLAVAANTFRHPALLAKSATVLDNITGGRFILGVGAGWHEGEHDQFGIPLPPMAERFDRYEHAVAVLAALFSPAARQEPGVTLDDPYYPLRGATNDPPPIRPEGPAIWLGGQKRRGVALAARFAEGWPMPGNRPGDVAYFSEKRDEILRALDAVGRDPAGFTFAAQIACGPTDATRREALASGRAFLRAGAHHLILGSPGRLGADGIEAVARQVAEPLRALR